MSDRMTVHKDGKPIYDIVLETSFERLPQELEPLNLTERKVCIVTDSHVGPFYSKQIESLIAPICKHVAEFVFPAGEEQKNLDTVRELYEFLILESFDRNDLLIALGGGVVGDLCGFAAATYLRGIRFVQIPTTLLSQVDSSIGGKTGVDFDAYKNMVGAFHMPGLVYTNVSTLLTLPRDQFSSGMGEIIKHGLIKNKAYYEWLLLHREEILNLDLELCMEMIRESNEIKRKVVEEDPTEQGERALLNFGHTLGHAVEKLMNFRMLHGHCVGLGCVAAAYLSADRGLITTEEAGKVREVCRDFGIPVTIDGTLNPELIVETTKRDKKMDSGVIKFILLEKIGRAYVDRSVTHDEMISAISHIQEGNS